MSRRFADLFTCYRRAESTGSTGEVNMADTATVVNGRCSIFQKADGFSWRDDRGRTAGQWRLITECAFDIAAGDQVTSGGRTFEVVEVADSDLRFQMVRLNALLRDRHQGGSEPESR